MNDKFQNDVVSDIFRDLVGGIVRHKNDFSVDVAGTARTTSIVFKIHDEDFGIVCGTSGKMFKSLVTLARAISERTRQRIIIEELPHPKNRYNGVLPPVKQDPAWKPDRMKRLLERVLESFCAEPFMIDVFDHSGKTTFEVKINSAEPWKDDASMELALTTIFHALGRPQGQHVKVVYLRAEAGAEPMPVENRGRYCK